MKMSVFKIFAYEHFVKTVIRISSSFEINHLISKELYQKQNGFKFIQEILVALHEIDFRCGEDTSFNYMTQY